MWTSQAGLLREHRNQGRFRGQIDLTIWAKTLAVLTVVLLVLPGTRCSSYEYARSLLLPHSLLCLGTLSGCRSRFCLHQASQKGLEFPPSVRAEHACWAGMGACSGSGATAGPSPIPTAVPHTNTPCVGFLPCLAQGPTLLWCFLGSWPK